MDSSDVSDGSNKRLHTPLPGIHRTSSRLPEITHARSRTDPPAPESQQHQKSQLHKRLGSHALRPKTFHVSGSGSGPGEHRHHSRRQHAKEAVQSAIELKPPISFDTLLRRDKKSPNSNRHTNGTPPSSQGQHPRDPNDATPQPLRDGDEPPQPVTAAQVLVAKQQNAKRDAELRESLREVEETAMSSTRRLDDTYYAILEKASFLRSALASLQQLADESRQLHRTFQEDATSMEEEVRAKLDGFANFDPQEKAVDELVAKLAGAKARTQRLNRRLEEAWTRVEAYEAREKAKENTSRKRWGWSSFVVFVVLAAIVGVLTSKHRTTVASGLHDAVKQIDDLGSDMLYPVAALLKPIIHRETDPYLEQLFDEL